MLFASGQTLAGNGEDEDWAMFGRVLSLVQSVVHVAARSNDSRAVEDQIDGLLSGRNAKANRLAGELMGNVFEDMPPKYRDTVLALANDFAAIARKDRARYAAMPVHGTEHVLHARKELAATGLRYYDRQHFLAAIQRDDVLAVELFVAGRGIDLDVRDANGMTALEHAQRLGNPRITGALAAAGR